MLLNLVLRISDATLLTQHHLAMVDDEIIPLYIKAVDIDIG